jgi:hypothetical protein
MAKAAPLEQRPDCAPVEEALVETGASSIRSDEALDERTMLSVSTVEGSSFYTGLSGLSAHTGCNCHGESSPCG